MEEEMIDLHTHSLFSDGVLLPAELVRRAEVNGYSALAITDHADMSNLDYIIPRMLRACAQLTEQTGVTVIPGIELTHIPPPAIPQMVNAARELGAKLVVVHGESIAEPVAAGTNLAALSCPIDILAHPGLITGREAKLAADSGIFLEISARRGHCLANGHVVRTARETGAKLVVGSDAHEPGDLINRALAERIALGAGVDAAELPALFENAQRLVEKCV
jgi:histidinol phosphatase-like PHP family hydrolase